MPNDLGLFDMLGNVYEWCQDRLESYRPGRVEPLSDEILELNIQRILRGGAFSNQPASIRSANRNWLAPSNRDAIYGFRPARTYR